MSYFKENIDRMDGYVPGSQPIGDVIKLNTNENPYPPAPGVLEAFSRVTAESLQRYPDPCCTELSAKYAEIVGVDPERVMVGNGSDNLIVMISRICGSPVVAPSPTFPYYQTQAEIEGVDYIEIPMGERFSVPVDGLINAGGAVTFLACPNSPTGTSATEEELDTLASGLAGKGLLVIDEAYVDFAERDSLGVLDRHDNVIILRTLSKGFSLAGLRLGFAVAAPEILKAMDKAREIYNVGSIQQKLAMAALDDLEHKDENARRVIASRESLAASLRKCGWDVIDSDANFVFASPPDGNGSAMHEQLKEKGIYVRYFNHPGLESFLRITVGTEDQNRALLDVAEMVSGT